ncbi:conserved hypothetical protein [gamma proteobacterium HTCC5015]|nr:conserved hypothetical protein [gamma proteobacterium HTCC5015]
MLIEETFMAEDTSRISITAHYTGYVWYRNGLSEPAFVTPQGKASYRALWAADHAAKALLGQDLETMLLQRHRLIDHRIESLLSEHGELQVLEIACGLSPRGTRFKRKYPGENLHYIEADLPAMAERKRQLLDGMGRLNEHHRVLPINILETAGNASMQALIDREFDVDKPLLVITEGLVNYFPTKTIETVWKRLAACLRPFKVGVYMSDLVSQPQWGGGKLWAEVGVKVLSVAARGKTALHYSDAQSVKQAFQRLGFERVRVHNPKDFYAALEIPRSHREPIVRIIEASVGDKKG